MIPRWLLDKRSEVCKACDRKRRCQTAHTIMQDNTACPINAHPSLEDEMRWERAWPEHAQRISGCCDSALHPVE